MTTKWRFRCYPDDAQKVHLAQTFGCCRVVYNYFLRLRTDAYRAEGRSVGYAETDRLLTLLKKEPEFAWLNDVSSVPLQQALRHLQKAFAGFFEKRTGYPSFKQKSQRQSATYTKSAFRWDAENRRLLLAKFGRLRVRWSREVNVEPSSVTITKSPSNRYYVTLALDLPNPDPLPKTGMSVGVDLGINRLATFSSGERVPHPRSLGKRLKKLQRLQRVLSRRTKGSKRRERQRLRIARFQEKIADMRKDHMDKLTTRIIRDFDLICIEDLNVRGMIRGGLGRSVSDAGLGMFRRMVEYKALRAGKEVVILDRFFPSSQLCSECGHRYRGLKRSEVQWTCPSCSVIHDRDENAAQNILAAGHAERQNGRGGKVRPVRSPDRKGTSRRNVNHPGSSEVSGIPAFRCGEDVKKLLEAPCRKDHPIYKALFATDAESHDPA